MTSRRLKLRTNTGEVREEFEYSNFDDIGEWIDSHVPDVPTGQLCEEEECAYLEGYAILEDPDIESQRPLATSYIYVVQGDHVCYTYVCWDCSAVMCDSLEPVDVEDYPTTDSGYAISPKHCS